MATKATSGLIDMIRNGQRMTQGQMLKLTLQLSMPAIMAQVSNVAMQYIDASMVGRLGAEDSAAIGIISTTTWLFSGVASAIATGFAVQVAHSIGGNNAEKARSVFRQSLTVCVIAGLVMASIGCSISHWLPIWLGGEAGVCEKATSYFAIYSACLPVIVLNFLGASMLRCSGNMNLPSIMNLLMCVLDVVFNYLLIYPTRPTTLCGIQLIMPGAGLGVTGAALGTALATIITCGVMLYCLATRSADLRIKGRSGSFAPKGWCVRKAMKIGLPIGMQYVVMNSAQILITSIVAPLGTIAIAANAFAVTAESICYMPGTGVADAATTLIGQSLGAGCKDLAKRFAKLTVIAGMVVMGLMGGLLYAGADFMMGMMSPVPEVVSLGAQVLRIEAWAEPLFAAAIVSYGVFVGAGSTVAPCVMNFASMWGVRLTLAATLAPCYGLKGVWTAMCIELCVRGLIFLARLSSGKWITAKTGAKRHSD